MFCEYARMDITDSLEHSDRSSDSSVLNSNEISTNDDRGTERKPNETTIADTDHIIRIRQPVNVTENDENIDTKPVPLKDMIDLLEKQKRRHNYQIKLLEQSKTHIKKKADRDTRVRTETIDRARGSQFRMDPTEARKKIASLRAEIEIIQAAAEQEVMDVERQIEEKRIEIEEINNTIQNNWGQGNKKTVTKWIKESNKQNFMYERVREIIQARFKKLTLALMILSGIRSLLDVSNFAISESDYPEVALGFKIGLTILGFVAFVITSYIKVEKFGDTIQEYTSYIERLENFLSSLVSVTDVKPELRPDGDEFVYGNRETYAAIYRDSPYITHDNFDKASQDYKDYVENADPEKQTHCSRKRANYAAFANHESDDDTSSLWSGLPGNPIDLCEKGHVAEAKVQGTIRNINREIRTAVHSAEMEAFDDLSGEIGDVGDELVQIRTGKLADDDADDADDVDDVGKAEAKDKSERKPRSKRRRSKKRHESRSG